MHPAVSRLFITGTVLTIAVGTSGCFAHYANATDVDRTRASTYQITTALNPYGNWVYLSRFGRVWQPYGMTADWRPFTQGQWFNNGQDWVWQSDYPWGWAAFHYGRWQYDAFYGWVWIPGNQYAPAWVVWRTGGPWIGWAPTPVGMGVFNPTLVGGIPNNQWCFVQRDRFNGPRVRARPAPRTDLVKVTRVRSRPALPTPTAVATASPRARPAQRARPAPIRVNVPPRRGFSQVSDTPRTVPPRGRATNRNARRTDRTPQTGVARGRAASRNVDRSPAPNRSSASSYRRAQAKPNTKPAATARARPANRKPARTTTTYKAPKPKPAKVTTSSPKPRSYSRPSPRPARRTRVTRSRRMSSPRRVSMPRAPRGRSARR